MYLFLHIKRGLFKLSGFIYKYIRKELSSDHADNYQKILMNVQMVQPYGYTKNDLFHMTRFMKTDIPLPTDPDLFNHI